PFRYRRAAVAVGPTRVRWLGQASVPGTVVDPVVDDGATDAAGPWVVIVYDNDYNTYEEVIAILMKATACSAQEAFIEAWEIDHLGKSVVHHGDREECDRAAAIIAQIGIRVDVAQE
ncbi:MAG: ATP-dependent Clp protease adaptor ClpS, partial [Fimbriimonadaceae bacterium]